MKLITRKETNAILGFGENDDFSYQEETGYPMFISQDLAFPTNYIEIYEVEEIPEEVIEKGYACYCYTEEDQFYWNPSIEIPDEGNIYGISNSLYNQILGDYRTRLATEVSER